MKQDPKPVLDLAAVGLAVIALAGLDLAEGLPGQTPAAAGIHEQQKLLAGDGAQGDGFGFSTAVQGDTAVVGALFDDSIAGNAGAAYVFSRTGGVWLEQIELLASDGWVGDNFGASVAASADTIVVGAPDIGAYVFVPQGMSWVEQVKLTPSDSTFDDQFGTSVDISGDTIVVGAHLKDTVEQNDGAAYVFVRNGTTWTEQAKLTASAPGSSDFFGWSVAISGDTVVVGAHGSDEDGVGFDLGAAYVFVRNGTAWSEDARLVDPDASPGDEFGYSVDVHGDVAAVGVRQDSVDGAFKSGSVVVWHREGVSWRARSRLTADTPAWVDLFGTSVAVSGDTILVGANQRDTVGVEAGSAYLFYRREHTWSRQGEFIPSDAEPRDNFGISVAIDESRVVVGANWDDDNGIDSGSAYVFSAPFRLFVDKDPEVNEITLSWIGGVSPFVVERRTLPQGSWQELTPPGGVSVRSWVDDAPLDDGMDYYYRVRPVLSRFSAGP